VLVSVNTNSQLPAMVACLQGFPVPTTVLAPCNHVEIFKRGRCFGRNRLQCHFNLLQCHAQTKGSDRLSRYNLKCECHDILHLPQEAFRSDGHAALAPVTRPSHFSQADLDACLRDHDMGDFCHPTSPETTRTPSHCRRRTTTGTTGMAAIKGKITASG
jgi:hypothetical protein